MTCSRRGPNFHPSLTKLTKHLFLFFFFERRAIGVDVFAALLKKWKWRCYRWRGKVEQQEQNWHCFLSQPQLCAHTRPVHCHLSLKRALASSPTVSTRPWVEPATSKHPLTPHRTPLPMWSGPIIWTNLNFSEPPFVQAGNYLLFAQLHSQFFIRVWIIFHNPHMQLQRCVCVCIICTGKNTHTLITSVNSTCKRKSLFVHHLLLLGAANKQRLRP